MPADARARELLVELWRARDDDARPEHVDLDAAEALGYGGLDAGIEGAEVVRRVLRLGRTLAEVALREQQIDAADSLRLVALTDEAAVQALSAWTRARYQRREQWLAHLTHDIKNPLNTLLNAIWLLREHPDGPGQGRFLDLAERGVRRIEAITREIRELQRHDALPLPGNAAAIDRGAAPAPSRRPARPPRADRDGGAPRRTRARPADLPPRPIGDASADPSAKAAAPTALPDPPAEPDRAPRKPTH